MSGADERDWGALVGQDLCITTNGETICGRVTAILSPPKGLYPRAVMDDGWAITLRGDTTLAADPTVQQEGRP